jgi:hypothetical protein
MTTQSDQDHKPSMLQTAGSVISAALGVQSTKNRERDFRKGSPSRFVIMGIIGTILFILTVAMVVRLVLKSAGV